jgi:predicted amidohydrolase
MPGRGTIDAAFWDNRERDPDALRREFDGMKGRAWLMRWLPARAWENGVYIVFSNAIGRDDDTIKPGLAMVLDPFGDVQVESRGLGDDVVVTTLEAEKLALAPGRRYLMARRPELYARLTEPLPEGQTSVTKPGWDVS